MRARRRARTLFPFELTCYTRLMPKGRVLIVDDEPLIAEYLNKLLEGWGYETAVASDGLSGLAKVEEFRPSVVVSDVYMPKLDGFGLLREMRQLHPETAVILLT